MSGNNFSIVVVVVNRMGVVCFWIDCVIVLFMEIFLVKWVFIKFNNIIVLLMIMLIRVIIFSNDWKLNGWLFRNRFGMIFIVESGMVVRIIFRCRKLLNCNNMKNNNNIMFSGVVFNSVLLVLDDFFVLLFNFSFILFGSGWCFNFLFNVVNILL